jgi:amino acid adenylation domain-containing protein
VSHSTRASGSSTFDDILERSNLTARQLLVYSGQQLYPGLLLYDAVYSVRWPGLDPQRFRAAWQALLDSCDVLRTIVEEQDGVPYQRVLPPYRFDVECVDLRNRLNQYESAIDEWTEQRCRRPLILANSVFDTALVRIADDKYIWFLNVHHIVVDAAAVDLLIHQLTELYAIPSPVPIDLPSFHEHVKEDRARRRSAEYETARSYWQRRLQSAPEPIPLYGITGSHTTRQKRVILRLDSRLSAAVVAAAGAIDTGRTNEDVVLTNLFAGMLAMYLFRVSGSERISIGVAFHNRRSELEKRTVGLFMEIVPVVLTVGPRDSLATLVRQAGDLTSEALRCRQYSVGNFTRGPAYAALLNYMRPLLPPLDEMKPQRVHPGHGAHTLSLSVAPPRGNEGFELWLDVNADLSIDIGAERMASHFSTLLDTATREPERPLGSLPLLTVDERRVMLAEWSHTLTEVPLPTGGCHEPFEAQAARTPDAVAAVCENESMTYAELNRRANRLARRLRALGAKRGVLIGIYLDRSLEMLVAFLGVLKSGATYVPLDPAYPQTRLRTMIDDAAPTILLTRESLAEALPVHAARVVCIDRDVRDGLCGDDIGYAVASDDLAYVMYTSGSTGTPKGVMVTHGGVVNYLAWRQSYFPLTVDDRSLQRASLSFDDSVWEILEPLNVGARVVLARPGSESNSAYLVKLIAEERITAACFVPSLLRMLIDEPAIGSCDSLRRLTTGGEMLSLALQERILSHLPAALYNGYGATEATIASTFWRCAHDPKSSTVPIGRAIANTEVYVLDSERQLVPVGVPGEIYIGGAGVARGYLNRPALTAERFIESPFSNEPGVRLYRTGDLGRWRADGVLEFLGRLDDQVKIRGVRVELGEIEAALADHPHVHSSAVVYSDTARGEKRLVAYVVPHDKEEPTTAELREFLRTRLPASMVPGAVIRVPALPVTPSGKLDRRALPPLSDVRDIGEGDYVAPQGELELRLVSMWEELLDIRPIGTRDDFFEIGGHSLLAVRLSAAIEKAFDRRTPPGLLFDAPTIEALARRISADVSCEARPSLVPLQTGDRASPLFLIHQLGGDVLGYRELARHLGVGQPVYGLQAVGLEDSETPLQTIEEMAVRYVGEVRTLQPRGPYAIGGHSSGGLIAFEMAQQLHAIGERVDLLAMFDTDATIRTRPTLLDRVRFHLDVLRKLAPRNRMPYLRSKLWPCFGRVLEMMRTASARSRGPQSSRAPAAPDTVNAAMERAIQAYRPQRYSGAITVFRASEREVMGNHNRSLGWGRLAAGGVRVIDVPGDHHTMLGENRYVRALADELRGRLALTQSRVRGV